jgi:hypothetical protein
MAIFEEITSVNHLNMKSISYLEIGCCLIIDLSDEFLENPA